MVLFCLFPFLVHASQAFWWYSTMYYTYWHIFMSKYHNFAAVPIKIIIGTLSERYNIPQHMNEFEAPDEL